MRPISCVFCDLLAGEGQASWVARRSRVSAFLPLAESRLSPAHTLVVPNEHAVGIHDASAEALQAVMLLAQEIARAMEATLDARGVNILSASGPGSDQSVPHLHLHVIPRWQGAGLDAWPSTLPNTQRAAARRAEAAGTRMGPGYGRSALGDPARIGARRQQLNRPRARQRPPWRGPASPAR